MLQMKSYSCAFNEKGDLIIIIPFIKGSKAVNPQILYDGNEHALFYHQPTNPIILDYLNEQARPALKKSKKILMIEVDVEKQDVVADYFVPVTITEKLPAFELSEKAPKKD